jgi:multidrug efflux pump subunit AcrB/outer membrane protein TolC
LFVKAWKNYQITVQSPFNMARNKIDIIGSAMRHRNIIFLIVFVMMIIGVVALFRMPRNEYPQFTIRQGVIVGIYPGASSDEVEAQLTGVVENYIFGYQEVDKEKTYSYSREGVMYIFVELNDKVKNADQFWSKMKHGLNELKMTLPAGVIALIANSDFGDTSALLITMSSETRSYKELEEQLKKLEAECRKVPNVSKIKHYGLQKEKIFVSVKPELLNEYNIKTLSLLGSYQMNGMVNYAGVLKNEEYNLAVHLPPSFESEKDLAEQIVYSDPMGNVVRLKDIATVERRNEDPDSYILQNGGKTILLSLEMQPGNNIVQFGKDVNKVLANFQETCPGDINVAKISELPKYVNDSITNFLKEFLIAIISVILVTMLLLPLRISSVAAMTVPIAVLITLGILYFLGVELHTVSLASLIVVLGMIVDNSIVIIDNHVEKVDHGGSPWHAAIISAKELFIPILTATLAIYSAYFPLNLFLTGTAQEFIETIPVVVGVSLTVSILVAVFVVPYLNFLFIKKGLKRTGEKKKRKTFLEILQNFYDRSLEKAFKYPKLVIGIALLAVAFSIILLVTLDRQLFPEVERNQFAVEIYLPTGSSLENTAEVVDSVAGMLMNDHRVTNVTSFIGTSSPRFHTVYAPNMPAPNFGQLLVNTTSSEATLAVVHDYGDKYANHFPNAHVSMRILALQPGKVPIELRITSDSVIDIRATQAMIMKILEDTRHITWIHDDWDQMQQGISVNLDRDKANRMGYSRSYLATSMMVGLDGLPLTTIWENDYPVEVRLVQEQPGEKDISVLKDQYITSPMSFKAVPLRSMATFTPEWTEGTIAHRNGTRTLTIMVDNDRNTKANSIFEEIRPRIEALNLPQGTSISYGGEYEGQKEVFTPMTIALALSVLIIFFIILFQFKKVKLTILIMSTMLLVLPGAAIGLKLMGYPFSLTSFLGITSLCGLVVRNGIILIDYLVKMRKEQRMTVYESALAAGKRRMRPIFLTSAAAAVGVIPMILSRSLLWGPLGSVICFGLIFGMVLTLYVLPLLYWLLYRREDRSQQSAVSSQQSGDERNNGLVRPVVATIVVLIGLSIPAFSQTTLTLDSCKNITLQNNLQIRNSNIEVEASRRIEQAAFTKYFPNISAIGLGAKFSDPLMEIDMPGGNLPVYNGDPATLPLATEFAYFPGTTISMLEHLYTGAVTAVQPIFTGGRIINGNQLARLGSEVSIQKQALSTSEALLKTEEYFWQIISLEEKMKTLDAYGKLLDTVYKDVNNAYNAGLISYNDVLKVSLKQSELKMNHLKLQNGLRLAKMSLCQHLGIPYDTAMTLTDTATAISEPANLYTDPQQALASRAEYSLVQKNVEAERLQSKMELGEYLPQVGIGVGAFTFDMQDDWNNNLMAFGTVTIPLTDWWGGSYNLRERRLKEEIAQNNADYTAQMLKLQIEKAWSDMQESWQQIRIAEEAIVQAKENLKITTDNYKAGTIGISDLLEAQAIYQSACDNLNEANCAYRVKMAEYRKVTVR